MSKLFHIDIHRKNKSPYSKLPSTRDSEWPLINLKKTNKQKLDKFYEWKHRIKFDIDGFGGFGGGGGECLKKYMYYSHQNVFNKFSLFFF